MLIFLFKLDTFHVPRLDSSYTIIISSPDFSAALRLIIRGEKLFFFIASIYTIETSIEKKRN